MVTISETDRARIADAVTKAEQTTSGEIVVVIADEVSEYREVPLSWAAGAALIAPALAVWLGVKPLALAKTAGEWIAAHVAALDATIAWVIAAYAAVQALIFVGIYLLAAWKPVRRVLTPRFLKRERAHKEAMAQFLATGLDGSPDRTGVVIFAALADHSIEIVADALINAKVGKAPWDEAVRAMQSKFAAGAVAEGFEAGISLCGAVLALHFPRGEGDKNTLPDAPRII